MLFGTAPVTVPELITTITSSFLFHTPTTDRTHLIRDALKKLGKSLGYAVFVSELGSQRNHREWLLDLVWWEPGRGAVLAAECEWGNAGEIMRDFEKLLAVKAPLKLMIFCSRRAGAERQDVLFRTDSGAILQALSASLVDFRQHVEGETYVLLEHVVEDSAFRAYEFRVPASGKLPEKFEDAKKLFRHVEVMGASAA